MNTLWCLIVGLLLVMNQPHAHAYVSGGSNLGASRYQSAYCNKPYKPFDFTSQWEVDSYNSDAKRYIDCIKTYVENANSDIKRIQEKANEAINEANSL